MNEMSLTITKTKIIGTWVKSQLNPRNQYVVTSELVNKGLAMVGVPRTKDNAKIMEIWLS